MPLTYSSGVILLCVEPLLIDPHITNINRIYTEMNFGYQSDKEFSLNGKITKAYMDHPRRTKPILPPSVLKEIILNGGQNKLSPERRFDQSVYYTASHLFDEIK